MTVAELIEKLKKFPADAKVFYKDGDYQDAISPVALLEHNEKAMFGRSANSVVIE